MGWLLVEDRQIAELAVEDAICVLTVAGESSPWLSRSCRLAVEAEERRLNDYQSGGE